MKTYMEAMKSYMQTHSFDSGDPDCKTVLDQLYHAYAESHENDPPDIQAGFAELENYLENCPYPTTMPYSTSAVDSVLPMNAKPSSTVCNTVLG